MSWRSWCGGRGYGAVHVSGYSHVVPLHRLDRWQVVVISQWRHAVGNGMAAALAQVLGVADVDCFPVKDRRVAPTGTHLSSVAINCQACNQRLQRATSCQIAQSIARRAINCNSKRDFGWPP